MDLFNSDYLCRFSSLCEGENLTNNDKRIESLLKRKKYGKAYPIIFSEMLKELRAIKKVLVDNA